MEDTLGNSTLFTKDMLGGKWSKPTELTGIDNSESPNYPFMMADGITFYFAQKGESSLGGYDIFVTRYNSETGEFLRPNNIGLPFNSKANDYMYVIDELDSLGWLVTDRNQPDGKVCIYTFVPSKTRENLNLEEMTEDEVKPFAEIQSIKAKELEKTFGENKAAGEKFLAENAKKEGVKVLPSGVQYKVLKEGTGAIPADTSLVKVNYEGRLINDSIFDSSYQRGEPTTFRANQVIKGWTEALCHMPAGSVWEVYIPQDLAYGEREQNIIKPFSALVFKIELLEVNGKK